MNIVVDTNVLISAVLWKGQSYNVLKSILEIHTLVQSKATLEEFENVIRREKFSKILQQRNLTVEPIIAALLLQSKIYTVSKKSRSMAKKVKIKDVDDLIFIELAFESGTNFIVSGDNHLLEIGNVGHIEILSVDRFLTLRRKGLIE
jgi:uncharacterized protein